MSFSAGARLGPYEIVSSHDGAGRRTAIRPLAEAERRVQSAADRWRTNVTAVAGEYRCACKAGQTNATPVRMRGYAQRTNDQNVWLFGGFAAAYVKAPTARNVEASWPRYMTPASAMLRTFDLKLRVDVAFAMRS
jgi:Tfp pilus assembly protein PilX